MTNQLNRSGVAQRGIRRLLTGASVAAITLGAQAAHAQVTGGGSYTVVDTTTPNVTNVTTTKVNGTTAFNRFSQFQVANLNTVNLVLPTATKTLVNVVSNDIKIDGTVNSRIASASGDIGGNLFFVTSGGFIIGGTGTVNTGRLIVRGGTLTDTQMAASGFNTNSLVDPVGTVTIGGKINAPGGIDIKATGFTLNAGGVLNSGAAGVAALPGATVSTVGLTEGAALVKVNGGIAIVGASSATVNGTLDAKAGTAGSYALGGGIDIASAGQINVGGTLTAWDGTAGGTAADIKVASSAQTLIDNSFAGMFIGNYYTASTAKSGVAVTGTITGGKVDITSDAEASTAADFKASRTSIQFITDYLVGKVFEKLGSGADVFYTHTDAQSAVTIGATANVAAKGDLTVKANSISAGEGSADIEVEGTGSTSLALAVGVAQVNASANVTVDGKLKAGGALSVGANNTATSDLEVQALSTAQAKAGAVAYTEVNATSNVTVGTGAKLDGSSVAVTSTNTQADDEQFKNTAVIYAKDDSPGGGVAAVLKLDLAANLTMNGTIGSVTVPGSVTIDAKTVTNEAINNASARTGASKVSDLKTTLSVFTGDQDGLMRDLLGKAADKGWELLFGGDKADEEAEPDPNRKTKRIGAAVAVLLDAQTANLSVGGTVTASGAVAVNSLVKDATVRNSAKAEVAAERKADGQATSIAGAAAWGSADYLSHATVGGTVTAGSLAVNATTERPRGGSYDLPFTDDTPGNTNDVSAWFADLKAKANANLGIEQGFFTSVGGATASTDSAKNAALSASISVVDISADTRAWINPMAALTLGGPLSVKALTDIVVMNLGGALPKGFGTSGGNAGGAAVAYTGISPTTVAGIGKGVTLDRKSGTDAVNVDVDAQSKVQTITLAPQAGKGNAKTGSGTFATNDIDGATRAVISKDARLDLGTGKLGIDALTNLEVWAVGGSIAVTKADGTGDSGTAASIGVAGALNLVEMDTFARVADVSNEYANNVESGTAAANAGITAEDVALTATDTGSINAISVAGSATSTTPAEPKAPAGGGTQGADKPKGTLDKIKSKLTVAQGLIQAPLFSTGEKYLEYANNYASGVEKAQEAASQDAISKGTPVTKGFGLAGSASVNLSTLTTRVETTGAVFKKAAASTAANASFVARAVEGVDMLSVTGGAAIATGSKPLESNTLISGAYGLSYSTNQTSSAHSGTSIDGFGDVAIEAAANGSRIGAGLALSADTTKTAQGQTVAGSVSHLIARDGAAATFTGGSITGGNATGGKASLLAYNGLVMGAGAGGLSWSSNNAAGGAVTVIDIGSPTGGAANARLVNTAVSGFTDLAVRGLTAARVAGIAAAGAVNTSGDSSKKALSIGLSINLVSMDSTALIDTGATGTGNIDVGGAVNVFAGDLTKTQNEAIAAQGKTSGTAGASMLGNFAIGSSDFSSDDPVQTDDLNGGTQILSIAVPIAASRGTALGVGFGYNAIDNDRTASIIGGSSSASATAIKAGSLSVQAIDHSDILALGVGIGGSAEGAGLMGSVSRNLIEGSSSAGIGKAVGAANNLVINITGTPSSTPNVSIGASGDGGIFALAGAVAYGKTAAGGIAVGINDITRTTPAGNGGVASPDSEAGLHATLDGVSFKGTPDIDVLANSRGRIIGNALAIAASGQGASVAGAATANGLAPTVAANAAHLYIDGTTGDLKIRAKDESSILSTALVVGISGQKAGVAAGVSVNRIDADVSASLNVAANDSVKVRNLLIDASSTAATSAFGVGAGGGGKFGGAGSIAINLTKGDTAALLSYTGGTIGTSGSLGVVAKRDATIDVLAGAVAVGAQGAAIGASIVVSEIGGDTSAKITGSTNNSGTITAFTGAGNDSARSLTGIRTGGLTSALPQFDVLDDFGNLALNGVVKSEEATFKGAVVNANSTAATRTIAITGAVSGQGAAIGVTGVVNNVTATTTANVTDTNLSVGSGSSAQTGVTLDVRASSQQVGMTFAGVIAVSGQGVAAAAPVISDAYSGTTSALVKGGQLSSTGTINVKAVGNQSSTALAIAASVSGYGAVSVAGVSPRFQSTVSATLDTPNALLARGADGVMVNADSSARALATFGSLAISGGGAGAGAVVVATNENKTTAEYKGKTGANGLGTVAVDAAKFTVAANGNFDAMVAGASVAASAGIALVGNGVGVVHKGEVTAKADALNYNKSTGEVLVKATEAVSIVPVVGQVAISTSPTGAGAALGAIAILSQSKVAATLARPTVTASKVDVVATGYNQIDAMQLGVAVGGVGIGANVTYIGVGAVTDTGALTASASGDSSNGKVAESTGSNGSGGNKNMAQLAGGGSKSGGEIAAQTNGATSSSEQSSAYGSSTARNAFTAATPAAATVTAEVTGNTGSGRASVAATTLTIDSDANLRSKSLNAQLTGGVAAGSATVGITRNAAQSKASLGAVDASGTTLNVTATTGEAGAPGAPSTITNPTKAADAEIYSGTVGVGALAVGVADVKLQTKAQAESAGTLAFTTANIGAEDNTTARTYVVGAVAGGGAVNVTVANSVKEGTVSATLLSPSESATKNINLTAKGLGGATAEAYAGAGGLIFAGNAAVATATDTRTVTATVLEGSNLRVTNLLVQAALTPLVNAYSFGVAVSGGVAAGASVANATANGTVSAQIGENSTIKCTDANGCLTGGITVEGLVKTPAGGVNVSATAKGSAGGYLAAVNGASAIANTSINTTAGIGIDLNGVDNGALVLPAMVLDIAATRNLTQKSESTGVTAAGLLAVGVQRAESTSGGTTRAAIDNVDGSGRGVAGVSLIADALDKNLAKVEAGAGGLGAGVAALAETNSNGNAVADLTPKNGKTFQAGLVMIGAQSGADYKADSDSVLATAVGASGTTSDNSVSTAATVNVGRAIANAAAGGGSRIEAAGFTITASNKVGEESSDGGTAAGAGGGVASGSAALVKNILNQTSSVNLRDGLTLRQYGGDATLNTRATFIDASVNTNRKHGATLEVGGAMQFPFAEVEGSYTANTNVNVGKNILIRADQGVGIGTNAQQSTVDTAAVQVYGLAGLGGGNVHATGNANGTVSVGDGTVIESMMDIRISAGTRSDGAVDDIYNITTQADTFNWTALPLDTEAKASSTVNANNQLILGAATIRSARDLILTGQQGSTNPSASGTGHNPYLELFSITNGSGETKTNATGSIKIDGTTLTAGYLNTRTITIENQSGQATRDGVAIAGATGFKVTTNDTGTDTDRLGQFTISATSFNTLTYVEQQITDVKAQITARGLAIPTDPATQPDGSQERQALRDQLNLAASQSDLVTTLAGLYETKLALAGTVSRPGVVVGGTVQATTSGGVTRYGVAANGGIFAAGGRVTLTSDTITGGRAASVTATGGGQVLIDNKTGYDTIIGNVFVPFKVNGAVTFAGKAQALPGTVTKTVPASDIEGLVSVKSGTDSTRADINVLGTVQNIAGAFKAATPKGNYVQFGAVNVASFAAEAPTGLFTVSSPGGTFSQGLPLSFFYGLSGTLSFYDVTGRGATIGSIAASEYLASYVAAKRVGVQGLSGGVNTVVNAFNNAFEPNTDSGNLMYDMFLRTSYSNTNYGGDFIARSDFQGYPGTIFGNGSGSVDANKRWGGGYVAWLPCSNVCEYASEDGNIGSDITNTRGLFVWDGESGSAYRNDTIWQLVPSFRDGVVVRDFSNGQLPSTYPLSATNQKASITAQQVQITAAYIDVSGEIIAGPTKQRSLTINNTVVKFQDGVQVTTFGQAAAAAGGSFDLLKGVNGYVGLTNSGNNIGAQFIATGGTNADGSPKGYIKLDDVAAAGGGSITLNGKILNTNPLGGGKLKVLNGFGNINVDNQTGYDIEVGTINAGLSAEGRITLRDSGTVTEFTNSVGGSVMKSVIVNGVAQGTTTVSGGLSDSNPIWYNPTGRIYYVWNDNRSIKRDTTNTGESSIWRQAVTPWRWDETKNNQAPQGGGFINLDTDGYYGDGATLNRALAGGNAEFVQVLSGSVPIYESNSYLYSSISPGQDGRLGVNYQVPLKADLTITSGAKATYPIAIVFDQGTSGGGLNITSNAGGKINLTGTLTFGGGTVGLSAANSGIVSGTDGLVVGKNVSLTARDSIGIIGNGSTIADAPFRLNLLGGSIYAASANGSINLALNSVAATGGAAAPTYVDQVIAPNGSVKLDSNASLIGLANRINVRAGGNVTLNARDQIRGETYYGAANLASQGLSIDLPDSGALTATAGGDIAIQQASLTGNTGPGRTLKIGEITTNGNVLLKAFGSVVAADATVTIDQEKLARFISAAKALQLAPDCASNCGTQDAATLGTLDQTIRADARAAYAKLHSTVPGEATMAENTLTALFGFVPASEGAIATLTINRSAKIEYQIRNQGRDAFDRYAMFAPDTTAELNRGTAVTQTLDVIGKVAAFGTKGGIVLSADSKTVSISDAGAATLQTGGELYQIALSALAANGQAVTGGAAPTEAQLQTGLQLYLDGLRAPVAALLPGALPTLTGVGATDRTTVSDAIGGAALTDWVTAQSLVSQRSRAVSDALGKVQDIQTFGANAGVSLSADRRTVSVTDWNQVALQPGGSLYQLALATLRSQVDANGLRDTVPLPTNTDVLRGLQIYLDGLRSPIADLLPSTLPTLSGTDVAAQRSTISAAISDTSLAIWATKEKVSAASELTGLFGAVPANRASIATIAISADTLSGRKTGSVWAQSMLDVAFPSTAFVPVADTQFETRKPVIKAQGVTIVAGNSIGAFDAQRTFSYDATGFTGAAADKDLATAYLASAGPGDLVVNPVRNGQGKVISVSFTTRREQPLTLNANGVVNAIAATDFGSLAPTLTSASGNVAGDIFLNNVGKLTIGTIVSEKWRTGTPVGSCALGTAAAATCESRIRLVAPDIVGATSGAAELRYTLDGENRRLDSGTGRAVVMGGLVRIEASSGSIVGANYNPANPNSNGSILVDAQALEVLRAAGDISLIRREPRSIGYRNNGVAGAYGFGNDLIVGDVFAGGRLQLDNPYGNFFVGRIDSVLESERRNSRIVAGTLAMRAVGDIGSADVGSTGIVGQFDIQTPIVDQLVAGYDYSTGRPSKGTAPAGLGTGSAFFALRGVVQFGGFSTSILGARGDITIGTLNTPSSTGPEIKSSIKFLSDIYVGGLLNLTTDGDVSFPDPDIKITGLDIGDGSQTQLAGVDYRPGVIDLSRLALNLKGKFDYFNTRSIILGSLTAGGGTVESSLGTVTVKGTLYGNGGPETPFTMKGKTGVEVGSTGLGSVQLIATDGDVKVTGQARATDLILTGDNVSVAGGLYGRSVAITADQTGTVTLGGAVMLQRDTIRPEVASTFTLTGGALGVSDIVSAQDAVTIVGQSITAAPRTLFLNTGTLTLTATGALNLDPTTSLINVGVANLSSGTAANGGSTVTLSGFTGGSLSIFAPVGIALGSTSVTDGVTLTTAGTLALNGSVTATNAVNVQAGAITFASSAGIRDASAISLVATGAITGSAATVLKSRGTLDVSSGSGSLTLGQVKGKGGSITISGGDLTIASTLASDGTDFRIRTGGKATFNGLITAAGNFGINAGTDLTLANPVMLTGGNGYANLDLDAGGALTFGRNARITATAQTASVRINAGSVAMDPLSSITGAAVNLMARGAATLGDIKASEAYNQTVSLRATGALSVGAVTGGSTTIAATGGSVTLRSPVKAGMLMVTARDDLTSNGLTATQATLTASLGTITLNGNTRVIRPDAPTAGRLTATAGTAIAINGAASATGGMSLSSPKITTGASGYITDTDLAGALTSLRADTIDVTFNSGTTASPTAIRVDARGRSSANVNDATFRFGGARGVQFDALYVNKGVLSATTALNILGLTMRDYLLLSTPNGSMALQGNGTAPAAGRTVQTGALSNAKLVMTPGSGAPAVTVNGVAK